MKEITEEQQWLIFELLEGNLSKQESESTLKSIQNNPELLQFYKELKMTYLVPDNSILFNKKQTLKKTIFTVQIQTTLKYAAAIAVFGIISWLFYFSKLNKINPQISSIPKKDNQNEINTEKTTEPSPKTNLHAFAKNKNNRIYPKDNQTISNYSTAKLVATAPIKQLDSPIFTNAFSFENSFLTQILENQYLSDEEKLSKILKWKRLNANAHLNKAENIENSNLENNKVEMVFTDFEQLEKDHQKQLRKLWFTEARNGLKYGKIPQVKLVSSKKENNWIPQVNLQLKANTTYINASLIQ
jgi:hypothetical protein